MFQHAFTDYLVQLQQVNQRWWKEVEQSKAAVNSPLNKAMQEVNLEDSLKFFEQAANQPAALLKVQTQWWEQQLQIWQKWCLSRKFNPSWKPKKGISVLAMKRGSKILSSTSSNNPICCSVRLILTRSMLSKVLMKKPKSGFCSSHVR